MNWILIAVGVLIVLLGVVYVFSKNKRPTDYYNLFVIGIIWVGFGLVANIPALWTVGLVLMAIGGFNHDKWKKNRRTWKNMNKNEKKFTIIGIVILTLLLLAGVTVLLLTR